jgi:hypothetical protein
MCHIKYVALILIIECIKLQPGKKPDTYSHSETNKPDTFSVS